MIDREEAVKLVKRMRDIDGYAEGDCVSRKGVIALLETIPDREDSAYDDDLK